MRRENEDAVMDGNMQFTGKTHGCLDRSSYSFNGKPSGSFCLKHHVPLRKSSAKLK
jgi:hypothetical protein